MVSDGPGVSRCGIYYGLFGIVEVTMFVVREVEYGGDVDGTGPERWLGRALGCFDTWDQALDFVDTQWTECEVVEE